MPIFYGPNVQNIVFTILDYYLKIHFHYIKMLSVNLYLHVEFEQTYHLRV